MAASNLTVGDAWWRLLVERAMASDYPTAYSLDWGRRPPRNRLLDELLPSLLHIKAVAILDAALLEYMDANGLTAPKKNYKNDLNGRVRFLADEGRLPDHARLHDVRLLRNALAHDVDDRTTWDDLDADLDIINATLQHLGYTGERPKFTTYGERSAARNSDDPKVLFVQDYEYGVKHGQTVVARTTWSVSTLTGAA